MIKLAAKLVFTLIFGLILGGSAHHVTSIGKFSISGQPRNA